MAITKQDPFRSLGLSLLRGLCAVALILPLAAGCGSDPPAVNDISCATDSDCAETKPYCMSGACVECTEAGPCQDATETCDLPTYQCKTPCTTDSDCTNGELCAPRGVCLVCLSDEDCTSDSSNTLRVCDVSLDQCV